MTDFDQILNSLRRHKELLESEKGTAAILEMQRLRQDIAAAERGRRRITVFDKIKSAKYEEDQESASKKRGGSNSGYWILRRRQFQDWSNIHMRADPILWINGIPGAGKSKPLSENIPNFSNPILKGKLHLHPLLSKSSKNLRKGV